MSTHQHCARVPRQWSCRPEVLLWALMVVAALVAGVGVLLGRDAALAGLVALLPLEVGTDVVGGACPGRRGPTA